MLLFVKSNFTEKIKCKAFTSIFKPLSKYSKVIEESNLVF